MCRQRRIDSTIKVHHHPPTTFTLESAAEIWNKQTRKWWTEPLPFLHFWWIKRLWFSIFLCLCTLAIVLSYQHHHQFIHSFIKTLQVLYIKGSLGGGNLNTNTQIIKWWEMMHLYVHTIRRRRSGEAAAEKSGHCYLPREKLRLMSSSLHCDRLTEDW